MTHALLHGVARWPLRPLGRWPMPRGVALPTAAPVARAPARVDGLGRRWWARSITDVVPFLRRRFRQVDDCFQIVEKHVGDGAAALCVYPRRTYPRRFRVWHSPPCLGSWGGCRTWVSASACEPGVAVRSAWLGRPPDRRSAVVGSGSRRVGRWSPSST